MLNNEMKYHASNDMSIFEKARFTLAFFVIKKDVDN